MGSRVNICNVHFLENPCKFGDEFQLEITFEVFEHLPKDLEWKLVYVTSSETVDQELDSALVGPTPEGKHKFVFSAPAPDENKIPQEDIIGVSVILLKLTYDGREFLNLGWFVSNEYTDEELRENPPSKPDTTKLQRTVKTDDIRVTSYPIRWTEDEVEEMPPADMEEEEKVDEADLMPLEDTEQDEEEEEEEGGDGDVDLEDSAEKDEAGDAEEEQSAPADVEMDAMENEETAGATKAVEPAATEGPLGDKTNDNA